MLKPTNQPNLEPTWVAATIKTPHAALVRWSGEGWSIDNLAGCGATRAARKRILASLAGQTAVNPINYLVNITYQKGQIYVSHHVRYCWDDFGVFRLSSLAELPLSIQPDFCSTILNPLVDLETGAVEVGDIWLERLKMAGSGWLKGDRSRWLKGTGFSWSKGDNSRWLARVGSHWADSQSLSPVWYNLSQAYILDRRGRFKRLQPSSIKRKRVKPA